MCYTTAMASLSRARIRALERERKKLLGALGDLSLVIRGSYLERFSTCVRPDCACHRGHTHGPRTYVVVTRDRKQRQLYVPKAQTAVVREGIEQHRRLMELVDAISAVNLELMRGGVLDERIK